MIRQNIEDHVNREPFRSFGVRLVNGREYQFQTRRDVHCNKSGTVLFYFDDNDHVTEIASEAITEILGNGGAR